MNEKKAVPMPTSAITSHSAVINTPDPGEIDVEKNKYRNWIYLAQAIDSWRIFPRIFIISYIVLLFWVVNWFMGLGDTASTQQASLVSIVVGSGAAWFGLYVGSGPKFKG